MCWCFVLVQNRQWRENEETEKRKEEVKMKARIEHKRRRSIDQSKRQVGYWFHFSITLSSCRKEWVRRQKIVHSYGGDDVDESELLELLEQRVNENTVPHHLPPMQDTMPSDVDFVLGGKKCKCGSRTYQRTSHRDCPMRKRKHVQDDTGNSTQAVAEGDDGAKKCKCGSNTHQRTLHCDCPLKKNSSVFNSNS